MNDTEILRECFRKKFLKSEIYFQFRNISHDVSKRHGDKGFWFLFHGEWDMRKVFLGQTVEESLKFISNSDIGVYNVSR